MEGSHSISGRFDFPAPASLSAVTGLPIPRSSSQRSNEAISARRARGPRRTRTCRRSIARLSRRRRCSGAQHILPRGVDSRPRAPPLSRKANGGARAGRRGRDPPRRPGTAVVLLLCVLDCLGSSPLPAAPVAATETPIGLLVASRTSRLRLGTSIGASCRAGIPVIDLRI